MIETNFGQVYELEPAKAKRLGGQTMLIPSLKAVSDAMKGIPIGTTIDAKAFKRKIAVQAGAEICCPMVFTQIWKKLAETESETPWWRVTLEGKPNLKLYDGPDLQIRLLKEEGVLLQGKFSKNSTKPVSRE